MSKSRQRAYEEVITHQQRPLSKRRRIRHALLKQQWEREMLFFPQPDPPLYKPMG